MSQQFPFNVKNSSDHYLHLTYYTEELIASLSDTGALERDLEATRDDIYRGEGIIFGDWDTGSSPLFWR